jgi:glycosyltransferase involved in cell wall biosynthesis
MCVGDTMKVLAIIPAYNEAETLESVVEDIRENAPQCDYVIVNDCSTDNTRDVCRENGFNVINLPFNLGIGGAMQTGYKYALRHGYDVAVQIDGDGQHMAHYIDGALEKLAAENADLIIGSRYIDKEGFQSGALRRMGIKYFAWLIRLLTGKRVTDPTSGFRAAGRGAIELFAHHYPVDFPEPETLVLLARNGYKMLEISVEMKTRSAGKSSITPLKSIYYMVKVSLSMLFAWKEQVQPTDAFSANV